MGQLDQTHCEQQFSAFREHDGLNKQHILTAINSNELTDVRHQSHCGTRRLWPLRMSDTATR